MLYRYILLLLLFWGVYNASIAQTCHPDDYTALTRLRDATNGGGGVGSWNTITNIPNGLTNRWTGTDVFLWHGIDTMHDGNFPTFYRVRKIDLNGNNFAGISRLENTIPDQLFVGAGLERVDTLILSNNNLVGTVGNLKTLLPVSNHALKFLDVSFNDFATTNSDIFVHLISNFNNLEQLWATSVMGTASSPLTFYNFPSSNSLKKIYAAQNSFSDTLKLGALTDTRFSNLNYLELDDNAIIAIEVPSGTQGGALGYLSIHNNNIRNFSDIANCLQRLSALVSFRGHSALDENLGLPLVVNGSSFAPGLNSIQLADNGLTGSIPVELFEDIPNLEELILTNNNLSGRLPIPRNSFSVGIFSGIRAYNGLNNIRYLYLDENNLEGKLQLDWFFLGQFQAYASLGGIGMPLRYFTVDYNRFKEVVPQLSSTQAGLVNSIFNNRFNLLEDIGVEGNILDFKDLFRMRRFFRFKQISILLQDHYVPQAGNLPGNFRYAPQDSVGIGGVKRRNAGDSLVIEAGRNVIENESAAINVLKNRYSWERIDLTGIPIHLGTVNPNGTFSAGPGVIGANGSYVGALGLLGDSTHSHKLGIYNLQDSLHNLRHFTACITNDSFPLLTICMKIKRVEVGPCVDDFGRPVECQTMVVQFHPDTLAQYSPAEQDSIRTATSESVGATPIATCVCGNLELWEISDTSSAMLEGNGSGTKNASSQTSIRPELLSAEPNYSLMAANSSTLPDTVAPPVGSGNTSSKTLVAIIDSGLDYSYTGLIPHVSEGASENTSCMQNAVWGWNFIDDNSNASDDQGHGTVVAGIVAGMSQQNLIPNTGVNANKIGIIPLKYTNKYGEGTLFNSACGLYYAADYSRTIAGGQARVRVINASWGYYGQPSEILEHTIKHAAKDCGILVVTSAGNDGILVEGADSLMHWPSNSIYDPMDTISIDNVLSVAGITNHNSNTLAAYSNYSPTYIDIAAQGDDNSTQAGSVNGFVSVAGTSFAAAQVSRAAALLFDKYPDATYFAVKYALMSSVDKLQSADSLKIVSGGRLNFERADSVLNAIVNKTNCEEYFSTIAIDKIQDLEPFIKVYPNPTSNLLNIDIDNRLTESNDMTIRIVNIQGQLLEEQILTSGTTYVAIPTHHLPNGVYFMQITTTNQQITKKIVISHKS